MKISTGRGQILTESDSTAQSSTQVGVPSLTRQKTPLLKGAVKRFLELYSKGTGISTKELKKLAPAFYSGELK